MTVLSLNVWGGRRHSALLPFLRNYGPSVDVFCLQEMFSRSVAPNHPHAEELVPDLAEQIHEALPNHRLILAQSREQYGELLALYVRSTMSILEKGNRQLVTTPTPAVLSSGGARLQTVRLDTRRGTYSIAHLHGYWEKDDGEDKPPRDEQISNILAYLCVPR